VLEIVGGMAGIIEDPAQALQWLGMVLNHPAMFDNVRGDFTPIVDNFKRLLPETLVDQLMEQGKLLDLNEVVREILRGEA
jgi:hypothetical protein